MGCAVGWKKGAEQSSVLNPQSRMRRIPGRTLIQMKGTSANYGVDGWKEGRSRAWCIKISLGRAVRRTEMGMVREIRGR